MSNNNGNALVVPEQPQERALPAHVHSVVDLERMADYIVRSGLFGMSKPEQAMGLLLLAQAEGVHPMTAIRDYDIIQGKPALKSQAMLARHQATGGKVRWQERSPSRVCATFSHPSGGEVEVEWTIQMANAAGLTTKPTWKQYPRQMLSARVISEGVRMVNPGVLSGLYTPEEVGDFTTVEEPPAAKPDPARNVKHLTQPARRPDGSDYFGNTAAGDRLNQQQSASGQLQDGKAVRLHLTGGKQDVIKSGTRKGQPYYQFDALSTGGGSGGRVIIWDVARLKDIAQSDTPETYGLTVIADVLVEEKDGKRFVTLHNLHGLGESAEPDDAEYTELGPPIDDAPVGAGHHAAELRGQQTIGGGGR